MSPQLPGLADGEVFARVPRVCLALPPCVSLGRLVLTRTRP